MKEFNEEMLEQELEELVGNIPEQKELEANIERAMKKKIKKTAARTMLSFVGIIIVFVLLINPFLNAVCLNPAKLNEEGKQQMLTTLRSYFETTEPYKEPILLNVTKKGFGRYGLEMQMIDRRGPVYYGNMNVWVDMVWGKYKNWKNPDFDLAHLMGRFDQGWNQKDEIVKKMKELPQSAIIYLSVGERNPRDLEELRKENVKLNWVELYQPNVEFQGGLYVSSYLLSGEEKAKEDMTEEELKEEYVSNLEDLLEHPEIWRQLELNSSQYSYHGNEMELLKECLEDAKKLDTLKTKNYCIYGKRDEMVEFLEKTDVISLGVDEIRLSEWSR